MYLHEKGPMGGAPYTRLKQGDESTFEVSILCTVKRAQQCWTVHCCQGHSLDHGISWNQSLCMIIDLY